MQRHQLNGFFDTSNCHYVKCGPGQRKVRQGGRCYCSTTVSVERLAPTPPAVAVEQYFTGARQLSASTAEIMQDPTTFLPEGTTVDSNGNIIAGGKIVGKTTPIREESSQAGLDVNLYSMLGAGVGAVAGHQFGGTIGLVAGAVGGYFIGNMLNNK